MRMRLLSVVALSALALSALPAQAQYQYTFDSSTYTVAVGQTVNVSVYLTQTSGTGLSGTGLQSGGVQLNYNTTYVTNTGTTPITPNNTTYTGSTPTGFDPMFNVATVGNGSNGLAAGSSVVGVSNSAAFGENAVKAGSGAPNTATSILLGTFQFVGVTAGQTLTMTTNSFPGQDVNVLWDGTVIDSMIANSNATINVVAVPEPGTFILASLLATGIVGGSLRRIRRQTVVA